MMLTLAIGRDDRDAVQLVLLAEAVVDLDDRFRAHPLALEVRAERDPVRIVLQIENLDDFEQAVGRIWSMTVPFSMALTSSFPSV